MTNWDKFKELRDSITSDEVFEAVIGNRLFNFICTKHAQLIFIYCVNGPIEMRVLRRQGNSSHPAMKNAIDIMLKLGWVEKYNNEKDKRKKDICLTDKGRAFLDKCYH